MNYYSFYHSFRIKISLSLSLSLSILQAGTCQILSLAENPRWSRVWQKEDHKGCSSSIQQHLQNKILTDIHHVKSEDNIADIFRKAGVKTDKILTALESSS